MMGIANDAVVTVDVTIVELLVLLLLLLLLIFQVRWEIVVGAFG